jgi:hypothetical protein
MPENNYIDPITKKRYYLFLETNIPEFKVTNDVNEMSKQVQSAITWLIAQTHDESLFPIISEENMNLGFTYNLLGLKPLAIFICGVLLVFDCIQLLFSSCVEFI